MGNVQTAATSQRQWQTPASADLVDLGHRHREPLAHSRRHHVAPVGALSRREKLLLAILAVVAHGGLIYWLNQHPTPPLPVVPPEIPPMEIEFTRPAPPVVEPPPPPPPPPPVVEPPPPVVDELAAKPAPKPIPKPKPTPPPKPVPKPVAPPPPTPAPPPVAAPAPVAPPAPPAPAPVTPPSANAAYLKNPAPEYPSLAQRRGWEGTVLLRVHVLANGSPAEIQIQTSSGRELLDNAAVQAVKRWQFVPSKQGDVARDGWVSVPIGFKLH
ncbi:energy transducer TonB [Pseudomonas turukhanskensis]|uniref:TonB C-terminal domain-containing protein n=1 Tax=Pseudomonas turukhanskensis TaxID=1806536 RepID=A0A9W6K7W8_9PSED|nr:energy transducer TonB [Pseudomonas turukhanskensis]GLK88583.1 hypothetical protein GCM10017655_16450 [Pseudomonas turukhanskensis]